MIYLALGANLPSRLGDPLATLVAAKQVIESAGISVMHYSRIWLTAPVPVSDQPWFHNAVIAVETELSAAELLKTLHKIENEFGRVRIERNEARILDIDIIAYHDEIINNDGIIIPHPRCHERGFVLFPLRDIAPDWMHPISKKNIDELIENLPAGQAAHPMDTSYEI